MPKEIPQPKQTEISLQGLPTEPFNVTSTSEVIEVKDKKGNTIYLSVPEWLKSLNTNGRGGT